MGKARERICCNASNHKWKLETPLYVLEVWENLSVGFRVRLNLRRPPLLPPTLSSSHSHKPSLIIEDGLPAFWAAPSLPRPHHRLPVPQAGEVHLVLQPWQRAQASFGMDARNLQASLVSPAFLYSFTLHCEMTCLS